MTYKNILKRKNIMFLLLVLSFFVLSKTPNTFSIYKETLSTTINMTISDNTEVQIIFNSMGGSAVTTPVTYNVGDRLGTLEYPTKTGFLFDGWYTGETTGTKVTGNTIVTAGTTYYAHWNSLVCKPAATGTLHSYSTTTFGSIPDSPYLSTGFAYDCDVNGDGTFDNVDERFYYMTDDEYGNALFLYSNNTHEGETMCGADAVPYNEERENNLGPTTAYLELPSTSQWSNVSLHNLPRQIVSVTGATTNELGAIASFGYTGKSARLITTQEINRACGVNIDGTVENVAFPDFCKFLLENTKNFSSGQTCRTNWVLETPSQTGNYGFRVSSDVNKVQRFSIPAVSEVVQGKSGVRPLIEVPLESVERAGNSNNYTIDFDSQGGSSVASINRYGGYSYGFMESPTKQGLNFVGWFTAASGGTQVTSESLVTGDTILYAHWTDDPGYLITFNSNGGSTVPSRTIYDGNFLGPLDVPTRSGYYFAGWYTDDDNTSIVYANKITSSTVPTEATTYYAKWITNAAAQIGDIYYDKVGTAIEDVPTTGVETTVKVLRSVGEALLISAGQNVNLNLQNYVINHGGTSNVIRNYGTLTISNGTIRATGDKGAIDNKLNAVLNITGGTIEGTGTSKGQAIYNIGGTVNISGDPIIRNVSNTTTSTGRPAIHNTAEDSSANGIINISGGTIISQNQEAIRNNSGTVNITGGTIISQATTAVKNTVTTEYSLVIGTQNSSYDSTTPVIQGATYGVETASNIKLLDGILKGQTDAINGSQKITGYESGTTQVTSTEMIDTVPYHTLYYVNGNTYTLTFVFNDGETADYTEDINIGSSISSLPTLSRTNYELLGWYTIANEQVHVGDTPLGNTTYYAHWLANLNTATISLNKESICMDETAAITVSGPVELEDYTITSSNPSVVTVNNNGNISPVDYGTATITIIGESSNIQVTKTISVVHKYELKFYHNDETADYTTQYVVEGNSITELPTVNRTDYILDGWYTATTGGTKVEIGDTPVADANYYAHWIPTINLATISLSESSILVTGTSEVQITGPSGMEAYTFESNDTSKVTIDANGIITGVDKGSTSVKVIGSLSGTIVTLNITVKNTHFVTWDTQGGTAVPNTPVEHLAAIGSLPTTTKENEFFGGWYKSTTFNDSNRITEATTVGEDKTYYARWLTDPVAEVGGIYYESLPKAIAAVPKDGVERTVTLLKDVTTDTKVESGQNINFNLQSYTITSTGAGDKNAIDDYGIVKISNGFVIGSGQSAAINCRPGAELYISGGTIRGTYTTKGQAVWNDGGTVVISGNPILTNVTATSGNNTRAAVHNTESCGTITITGGSISSQNFAGVLNACETEYSLIIGTQDNAYDVTSPVIVGKTYGISTASNIKMLDGIIKGQTAAINNESKIPSGGIESGAIKQKVDEFIGGTNYHTLYYTLDSSKHMIRLNTNGGTLSTSNIIYIDDGDEVGTLPTPTKGLYTFDGWYIDAGFNTPVTTNRTPTSDEIYYAKWTFTANNNVVQFNPTTSVMSTYYSSVGTWKSDSSTFQSNMIDNFNNYQCKCATDIKDHDGTCTSSGTNQCDKPNGYDTGANEQVNVYLYDEVNGTVGSQVNYTKSDSGVIYNLIPGQAYKWVLASDSNIYGYVKSTATRRILDAGVIGNARDLGGLTANYTFNSGETNEQVVSGTVKYGKLFRGTKLGTNSSAITELQNLGITEEVDLRKSSEHSGDVEFPNLFKLRDFQHYQLDRSNYPTYYANARSIVHEIMTDVVNNNNIYFHCRIGADRTGSVAYILEGLLGVVDEDRLQDYELTFFSGLTNRHRFYSYDSRSSVSHNEKFVYMYNFMTSNQDIYDWYMDGIKNDTTLSTSEKEAALADEDTLLTQFRSKMLS